MVPRSMLLVLTSDGRAGSEPANRSPRNAIADAVWWLLPLPGRHAVRSRARLALAGREVHAIPMTGEGGRLRVRRCWSGSIIELLGEHDLTTARAVEDCLEDALTVGSAVIDLSAAALIDCSILGALRRAVDRNGTHSMVVCAPPGTCPRRLIDIAASSNRLGIAVYDTRAEALCAAAVPGV
jgi:anti-anti-sigma regulatory factor